MSVSKFRRLCPKAKGFVGEEINIEGKIGIDYDDVFLINNNNYEIINLFNVFVFTISNKLFFLFC